MVTEGDPELVQRSLAGETGAFAQLVEKHQRLVFGVALSGARNPAVAEEVAQEAFVEAWRELRRLRDPGRVGAWIAGIARNLARGWSRTHARRERRAEQLAAHAQLAPTTTPLDAALANESRTLLQDALDEVPAAYREVLVLFYMHGQSIGEVATGLDVSEDVVKQRLTRGRRALRDSLERTVEDQLGKVGPSTAFTSLVMVAVSSAAATKATAATTAGAAGKLLSLMSAGKIVVGVASLVLVSGALWYGLSRPDTPPPAPGAASGSAASEAVAAPPPTPRVRAGARRFADAAERTRLLASVRQAQERRATRTAASSSPSNTAAPSLPAEEPGELDKDYIRSSVRELLPFIQECYETMLLTQPAAQGTIVVNFTIEGEPETGGLVTECAIDEKSELADATFQECVRETMFALEIAPPHNGGKVKVNYPFAFRISAQE